MNCNDVLDALKTDAPLEPAKKQAIDEHLQTCEPCRTLWNELAAYDEVSPQDADYVQDPPALRKKILDRAHAELSPRAAAPRPARIFALVAMGAAGVVTGVLLDKQMQPQLPDFHVPVAEWVTLDGSNLDLQTAELLEKHGRHEQAVIIAQHALDNFKLTADEKRRAEAIVKK